MATVNPQIPETNAPFYLNLSRAASDIKPNLVAAKAIAGFADVIDTGVKGADTLIKSSIEDQVRAGITSERQGFTGALENLSNIPVDQRIGIQPTISSTQPTDLIPGSVAAPIPSALQSGIDQAGSIVNANAMGKFRPTDYHARLTTLVQDLYTQHPGYKDYIDAQVSKLTGGNPANQYMADLLKQANDNRTTGKSDVDWALGELAKKDVQDMPGLNNIVNAVASGKVANPRAYVINALSGWRGGKEKIASQMAELSLKETNSKDEKNTASTVINSMVDQVIGTSFTNMAGVNGGITFQDLKKTVDEVVAGHTKLTADQETNLKAAAANLEQNMYQTAWNMMNTQKIPGKDKTVAEVYGTQEAQKELLAGLDRVHTWVQYINNGDYGPGHRVAQENADIANQGLNNLYNSNDINVKTYTQITAAMSKLPRNAGTDLVTSAVARGLLGTGTETLVNVAKQRIATQPDPGKFWTLQETIDKMRSSGVGKTNEGDNQAYKSMTDLPGATAKSQNIPEDTKRKVYDGSYGPGNENLIKRFAPDMLNKDGKLIPGQHDVFVRMTNPQITDDIYKLDHTQPGVWTQYKAQTQHWFSQLFGDDLRAIDTYAQDPNIKFVYDSDKHMFRADYADTFFVNPYQRSSIFDPHGDNAQQARRKNIDLMLANINSGLRSMSGIIGKENGDVNAYLQSLINAERKPEDNSTPGIVDKLWNAVTNSAKGTGQAIKNYGKGEGQDSTNVIPPHEMLKGMFQKMGMHFPTLQDYSQEAPSTASPGQIKGTANAAHVSAEWGNPLSPAFKQEHLTSIEAPGGHSVQVNKIAADAFKGFLGDLAATGYKINNIGGYSLREKRGAGGISQHAWGNAIDINPDENPQHGGNNLPKNVSDLAAKWGITWGGDWSKKYNDPMHFEYTGYKPKTKFAGYKGNKS